jgi:hypothetical protein
MGCFLLPTLGVEVVFALAFSLEESSLFSNYGDIQQRRRYLLALFSISFKMLNTYQLLSTRTNAE